MEFTNEELCMMMLGLDAMMYNCCVNEEKYTELFERIENYLIESIGKEELDKLENIAKYEED